MKMYYNRRQNVFHLESDIYSQAEIQAQKKKTIAGMRMQDNALRAEYTRTHAKGYCPHCHMLLPLSGKCDCQQ